jgi:hypothetical protein
MKIGALSTKSNARSCKALNLNWSPEHIITYHKHITLYSCAHVYATITKQGEMNKQLCNRSPFLSTLKATCLLKFSCQLLMLFSKLIWEEIQI